MKNIQKIIINIANKYNLMPEIIANKKSILNYIRGDSSELFKTTWRKKILIKEIKCQI